VHDTLILLVVRIHGLSSVEKFPNQLPKKLWPGAAAACANHFLLALAHKQLKHFGPDRNFLVTRQEAASAAACPSVKNSRAELVS